MLTQCAHDVHFCPRTLFEQHKDIVEQTNIKADALRTLNKHYFLAFIEIVEYLLNSLLMFSISLSYPQVQVKSQGSSPVDSLAQSQIALHPAVLLHVHTLRQWQSEILSALSQM